MSGAGVTVVPPVLAPVLAPVLDSVRILVVGDIMLDRYWFGEVARISPEAPVPSCA